MKPDRDVGQTYSTMNLQGAHLEVHRSNEFDLAELVLTHLQKHLQSGVEDLRSGILRIDGGWQERVLKCPSLGEIAANIQLQCLCQLPYGRARIEVKLDLEDPSDELPGGELTFNMTTWRSDVFKLDPLDEVSLADAQARDLREATAPADYITHKMPVVEVEHCLSGFRQKSSKLQKLLEVAARMNVTPARFRNHNNGKISVLFVQDDPDSLESFKAAIAEETPARFCFVSTEAVGLTYTARPVHIEIHQQSLEFLKPLFDLYGRIHGIRDLDREYRHVAFELFAPHDDFLSLMHLANITHHEYFDRRRRDYYIYQD